MDFGPSNQSQTVTTLGVTNTIIPSSIERAPSFSNEDAPNFGENVKEDQKKRQMMEAQERRLNNALEGRR